MSEFRLSTTLGTVLGKLNKKPLIKSHVSQQITELNPLYGQNKNKTQLTPLKKLAELLVRVIGPQHQTVVLVDDSLVRSITVSHNFWHTHRNHGIAPIGDADETFEVEYFHKNDLEVKSWEFSKIYPQVKRNEWYVNPSKNRSAEIYLSRGQLANLVMTESVELNELVLNDDDRQFEHLLSVELSAPLVIQWKHLTFGSKTQILSLVLPFLRQLYQFVIRDRVFHMRRNQVPKGKIKSIIPTKYNLSQRLAGIEDLLIGQYNAIQKIKICALYYSMLPEDSGPDLFLLDVISHSVKLNRLVTNQELLDLAKQSIEEKRNVRLLNYSHEQYKASGKQELASRKIKWNQDETIQELAKRYREGNIYRLITNCFETHQTIK